MSNDQVSGYEHHSEAPDDFAKNERNGESLVRLTLYPANKPSKPSQHLKQKRLEYASQSERELKKAHSLPKLLTKSFLPFCILYLLSQKPRYGNEILNWLRDRAGLWAASPGTIYPLLQHLEQDGLIQGRWEPGIKRPRHVYEITNNGRTTLSKLQTSVLGQLKSSLKILGDLVDEIQTRLK